MKHVAYARSAARWAGVSLSGDQIERLGRYARWLEEEAIPAGGLGPREAERIWPRHIADSLTFLCGLPERGVVADIGTGVGLPGIPLAIARPELQVWLVDRGGRRTRLLERVATILELDDVVILRRDVEDLSGRFDGLAFRGSIRAAGVPAVAARLLGPGGSAVIGLSRRAERPDVAEVTAAAARFDLAADLVEVPAGVLDGPAWLLKMAASGS